MVYLVFDACTPVSRIALGHDRCFTVEEIRQRATEHLEYFFGCRGHCFYLLHNGKLLQGEEIQRGEVHVVPRLLGGKGGFGSMLRAIGAQIEKTTNREACRDLSGRRLRDINEEKRLKKWIAEQAEREQEARERRKKKLERLNEEIKHEFKDEEYTKARLEMPDKIHEAIEQGLKAATEEPKPEEAIQDVELPKTKKRPKGKLWVDDLLDDSEESEKDEDEESPKKKIKFS